MSVEKVIATANQRKVKISQEPIISESKVETCKVIESRENAGDRVGIGFKLDWSGKWRSFWTNHVPRKAKSK